MITAIIVMAVLCCLMVILTALAANFAYRAVKKNFEMQDRMKEYNKFFELITEVLEQDTQFLRSELIQRLSMEMMETKQLNSAIVRFQTRLEAIKVSLREYKMME